MVGGRVTVSASFSINGREDEVLILRDNGDFTYVVEYPNGYTEILPIGAFIGY
jgi:hypothetical protein